MRGASVRVDRGGVGPGRMDSGRKDSGRMVRVRVDR
jgi:hypothetical protein